MPSISIHSRKLRRKIINCFCCWLTSVSLEYAILLLCAVCFRKIKTFSLLLFPSSNISWNSWCVCLSLSSSNAFLKRKHCEHFHFNEISMHFLSVYLFVLSLGIRNGFIHCSRNDENDLHTNNFVFHFENKRTKRSLNANEIAKIQK